MMGSFLSRTLLMAFGYAYPAYECFKAVENNKPEIQQLRFWCQYWVLVSTLTVGEKFGDVFVSWLPFYNEVKLAFVVYLWYPKWKGTTYVYNSFLRPYVVKHETEIDRNLFELKVKTGEVWVLYWHKAMSYGHTGLFQILQYFSSQSSTRPCVDQENLGKEEMVASSHVSLTKPKQLKQDLPVAVSSGLSVSVDQSTTNEAELLVESQNNKTMLFSAQSCVKMDDQSTSTASLGNGDSNSCQELQPSYKKSVSKRRGIWRIFKCTRAH